ncbi:MAG TPA: PAS domain-containing protein [Herbaspirillum sp.]|jgi:PAS domain S-box-containing protein|nr:PAS domain-containing protein [Herbaspirillum sp.]
MGMDSQYDSHSDTVAKVLPAVQHSVDILSVRQTHTHTFWIISVARALAIIVLLIGGFVFTASNLNGVYQTALSRLSDMGGGTAACFMLAGLALYLQCLETGKLQRIGVRICAALLLLLSGASLWLPLGSNPFPPFDILISSAHPACSIAFILAAATLALHDLRIKTDRYPAEYLAGLIIVMNLIALLGYAYQLDSMMHLLQNNNVPLPTAVTFIFFGVGCLMARPSHHLMSIIVRSAPGGQMLRRSLPQMLALLVLVNWLVDWGARHSYYHYSAVAALLTLINCTLILLIFWRTAARVDQEYGARIHNAAALAETTALLIAVSDNTHDPIFVKDNQGRLIFANPATLKQFDKTWDKAIYRNSRDLYPDADEAEKIDREDQHIMSTKVSETLEQTLHLPTGVVTYQTTKAPWLDKRGKVLGVVGISTDITARKLAEDSLRERESQLEKTVIERTTLLRELTNHLETVREEEKQAIARELHDNMGASLTALSMHLETVYKLFPNEDKWRDRKGRIQTLLNVLVATTRRIQTELRPNMLDLFGLKAAIVEQLDELSQRSGLICKASMPDEDVAIGHQMEIAIYRMLQEILNNVTKHAQASRIDVILDLDEDRLSLTVRDDGIGISDARRSNTTTYGLRGLRERATFFGGKVDIRNNGGKGTVIAIEIPLAPPTGL